MRRIAFMVLALTCLLGLWGCAEKEDPVIFYYPNAEVSYHTDGGVLTPETRDTLSRSSDLSHLLSFYLEGPINPALQLPVPEGTKILRLIPYDGGIKIVMSQEFSRLEGMDLTLACAGISKTCFGLTDLQEITFAIGTQKDVVRTVTRDSFVLTDTVTQTTE